MKLHLLTLVLVAALALTGECDRASAATPAEGGTPAVRITDAAGRVVELPRLPQRIVVVGNGPYMALDLLYMFPGASSRIVGTERKGPSASDFLPLVDSTFAGKPTMLSPGPEQIAVLHPDLVLTRGRALDQSGTALEAIHVPIVYLGMETPEQFYGDVANMGALLGQPERAREITAYFQSRVARIRDGWQGVPAAERPRVLVVEYTERGGAAAVRVPAKPWMQTQEVETAGGRPAWLDSAAPTTGWTVSNIEQIARWDPDQIILVVWHTLDPEKVVAALKTDPQWRALRAVRSNALRAFPSDIYGWDTPDPRWLLGMTWMAKALYPESCKDLDVAAEVRSFFGTLYGMDADAIDRGLVSKIRLDVR